MGKVDGMHEVHVLVKFRVPPGHAPEQVAALVAQNGVNVALGLWQFLIGAESNVVDVAVPKPKLTT